MTVVTVVVAAALATVTVVAAARLVASEVETVVAAAAVAATPNVHRLTQSRERRALPRHRGMPPTVRSCSAPGDRAIGVHPARCQW